MSESYFGKEPAQKVLTGSDIAPAVIDNTKLSAGVAQNVTTLSSTQALTLAMTGLVLVNATSASVTLTLPAANAGTLLSYRIVRTDAAIANTVIIQRAGSDLIDEPFNATTTSVVLTVDQNSVILISDGTSVWYLGGGAVAAPNTGRKNALINANFDVWQRNTTFTLAAATGYTADRWVASSGTGGSPSVTITRQALTLGQTGIPNEPTYVCQLQQTALASSTNPSFEQRVEGVRTFANKPVTLSFYAYVSASTLSVTPSIVQNFGTGGSPSGSVTVNGSAITLTTTPTKFSLTLTIASISGKTIGSNGNDFLSVFFGFPLNATWTATFSQVQIEEGSVATQFERRAQEEELSLCQRYYVKTFPQPTAPVQSGAVAGGVNWITQVATAWSVDWVYPVVMRAAPSITTYNPSAANANWRDVTGTADVVVTVGDTSDRKVTLSGAGTTAAHTCVIHVAGAAEL